MYSISVFFVSVISCLISYIESVFNCEGVKYICLGTHDMMKATGVKLVTGQLLAWFVYLRGYFLYLVYLSSAWLRRFS